MAATTKTTTTPSNMAPALEIHDNVISQQQKTASNTYYRHHHTPQAAAAAPPPPPPPPPPPAPRDLLWHHQFKRENRHLLDRIVAQETRFEAQIAELKQQLAATQKDHQQKLLEVQQGERELRQQEVLLERERERQAEERDGEREERWGCAVGALEDRTARLAEDRAAGFAREKEMLRRIGEVEGQVVVLEGCVEGLEERSVGAQRSVGQVLRVGLTVEEVRREVKELGDEIAGLKGRVGGVEDSMALVSGGVRKRNSDGMDSWYEATPRAARKLPSSLPRETDRSWSADLSSTVLSARHSSSMAKCDTREGDGGAGDGLCREKYGLMTDDVDEAYLSNEERMALLRRSLPKGKGRRG